MGEDRSIPGRARAGGPVIGGRRVSPVGRQNTLRARQSQPTLGFFPRPRGDPSSVGPARISGGGRPDRGRDRREIARLPGPGSTGLRGRPRPAMFKVRDLARAGDRATHNPREATDDADRIRRLHDRAPRTLGFEADPRLRRETIGWRAFSSSSPPRSRPTSTRPGSPRSARWPRPGAWSWRSASPRPTPPGPSRQEGRAVGAADHARDLIQAHRGRGIARLPPRPRLPWRPTRPIPDRRPLARPARRVAGAS